MALRRIDEWHANGSGEKQNYAVKEEKEERERKRKRERERERDESSHRGN